MKIWELQGSDIYGTPGLPGIYAWYYRPRVIGNREAQTLAKLVSSPSSVKTEIALRYGVRWEVDSNVNVLCREDNKRQPADKVISEAVKKGNDAMESFLKGLMAPYFSTPLYIGIDEKNVRRRIVEEHYNSLSQFWEPNARINRYLEDNPDANVDEVLNEFSLTHSFAINARVKGIAPRDLLVCVCAVDPPKELQEVEKILQILADPICGRR